MKGDKNINRESVVCATSNVGDRFGKLVLREKKLAVWIMDCDCGGQITLMRSKVIGKNRYQKSCGVCYRENAKIETERRSKSKKRVPPKNMHPESTLPMEIYKLAFSTKWVLV